MHRSIAACLLAIAIPLRLLAADGDIDPSFGIGGWATLQFDAGDTPSVVASRVAADGKILVAGNVVIAGGAGSTEQRMYVARFNKNGVVDSAFGAGGKVYLDFGAGNGSNKLRALATQADGRILIAGSARAPGATATSSFAIARLDSDGTPDASFGKPATPGQVLIDFDLVPAGWGEARALVAQADGRIVVVGSTSTAVAAAVAVLRLEANGTLDTGFNLDGKATYGFPSSNLIPFVSPAPSSVTYSYGRAVAVDDSGDMVVAGYLSPYYGVSEMGVLRLLPDGRLDAGFNATGMHTIYLSFYGAAAEQVAIQDDGKVVLSGIYDDLDVAEFAAVRLGTGGLFDTTFNGDGIVQVPYYVGYGGGSYSLLLHENGKLLLSGTANVRGPFGAHGSGHTAKASPRIDSDGCWITLLRLLPNGAPDTTFGGSVLGQQIYDSPLGTEAWPNGVLAGAQDERPILAVGYDSGVQQINVTRLLDSGVGVASGFGKAASH